MTICYQKRDTTLPEILLEVKAVDLTSIRDTTLPGKKMLKQGFITTYEIKQKTDLTSISKSTTKKRTYQTVERMRKGKMVKTKPEMFDKATRNMAGRIRTQNREHEKADEATRVRVRQYDYNLRLRVRGRVRQPGARARSGGTFPPPGKNHVD